MSVQSIYIALWDSESVELLKCMWVIIVYKKDSKLSDVKEMETELAWIHEQWEGYI